jgi:hypothetical protein
MSDTNQNYTCKQCSDQFQIVDGVGPLECGILEYDMDLLEVPYCSGECAMNDSVFI